MERHVQLLEVGEHPPPELEQHVLADRPEFRRKARRQTAWTQSAASITPTISYSTVALPDATSGGIPTSIPCLTR